MKKVLGEFNGKEGLGDGGEMEAKGKGEGEAEGQGGGNVKIENLKKLHREMVEKKKSGETSSLIDRKFTFEGGFDVVQV